MFGNEVSRALRDAKIKKLNFIRLFLNFVGDRQKSSSGLVAEDHYNFCESHCTGDKKAQLTHKVTLPVKNNDAHCTAVKNHSHLSFEYNPDTANLLA